MISFSEVSETSSLERMRKHSLLMFIFIFTDERHADFKEVDWDWGRELILNVKIIY